MHYQLSLLSYDLMSSEIKFWFMNEEFESIKKDKLDLLKSILVGMLIVWLLLAKGFLDKRRF